MNCRTLYTVVRCEAPVRKAGPHRYIVTEVLDARGAPRSARVQMWGLNRITFYKLKNGEQVKLGEICHHDLMRASPVVLVSWQRDRDVVLGQVLYGATRYVRGLGWCVRWTIMDNTDAAKLVLASIKVPTEVA